MARACCAQSDSPRSQGGGRSKSYHPKRTLDEFLAYRAYHVLAISAIESDEKRPLVLIARQRLNQHGSA